MSSFTIRLLCLMLVVPLCSSPGIAGGGDRSERRAGQASDELRADIRQQRLKKVEDLDTHRLQDRSGRQAPATTAKPKPDKK